jgi:hypothetical protein
MKEQIQLLIKERNSLLDRATKIENAIKSFQEICNHDWKPNGHDSHKDFEKCDICCKTMSI